MTILAGAALALGLSACGGGGGSEANDANAMSTGNAMIDPMMDPNMTLDANGMNASGGMGANGAVDANTQNMMQLDANTNAPDTNLANGL
ncbi:MAG TPA: hypothetical protein VF552_05985 [Allosphingosinicella sp.]|jgi:hypothetical protein